MDSSKEAYGQLDITYYEVMPPSLLTSKEPFCTCVVRELSFTLQMGNMWSFIWVGPSLFHHLAFMEFLLLWRFFYREDSSAWHLSISCLNWGSDSRPRQWKYGVLTSGLPRKFLGWLYFRWLPSHHHLHPLVGTPAKSRTVSLVHWPCAPCPAQFLTLEGTQ